MVYRGQRDSGWGLQSSLARTLQAPVTEAGLIDAEKGTLEDLRSWQLQLHPAGGILPALPLLATYQHLGGKTRLIDATHSVLVALWFAVEPTDDQAVDGRLFAMTYSQALASLDISFEAKQDPFWWDWANLEAWPKDVLIWSPPPLERRMMRQQSAFIVGRMASAALALRSLPNTNFISTDSWLRLMSISKRAYKLAGGGGAFPATPQILFTNRVDEGSKESIRRELDLFFSISARTLYPDLPGFVKYA
jgi:hypothetical protein